MTRKPGRLLCLAHSAMSYFTLTSCEVTVLVNGLAVKRITAVILVSGKLPVGSPLLEFDDELLLDDDDCELELDAPPVWTYAVT